jgi:hypothetical protein
VRRTYLAEKQTFSVLSCMMLGRNATLTMKKTQIPEYLPISPLAYLAPLVMPNQTRSAKLYPAAASNSCMSRESKLLRNRTKQEKTGRNDLADLASIHAINLPTFTVWSVFRRPC